MTYVYTGPSWAASSYPIDQNATNLAREWQIPFLNKARPGTSVLDCVESIKYDNPKHPIIWVYNEPFNDLTKITKMSFEELLTRPDWKDIWNECNEYCLSAISSLQLPVLLIGGHSDIVNCKQSNITVACDSWQKWLALQAGMAIIDGTVHVKMADGGNFSVNQCWGAEVLHKFIHEHPNINPDDNLINSVWDIFFFWKELEKADLFFEVHPNRQGNRLFAKFLLPTITTFLQENQ